MAPAPRIAAARWRPADRMRIVCRAATAWLVLAAAPACSSDSVPEWVEVGVATNGVRASIDRGSVTEEGRLVVARQRFLMPEGVRSGPARVEQEVAYDCVLRTAETRHSAEYDARGALLREDGPAETFSIRPETLPEYIFDALC